MMMAMVMAMVMVVVVVVGSNEERGSYPTDPTLVRSLG